MRLVKPSGMRSPRHDGHRSGAGFDLGDDAGGHGRPDDVVAAVVLSGDAVEGLDVDGVGSADERFQFGAAAIDTHPFVAGSADLAADLVDQRDRMPLGGVVGGGNPSSGSGFQPAEGRQTTVKTTTCAHPFAAR